MQEESNEDFERFEGFADDDLFGNIPEELLSDQTPAMEVKVEVPHAFPFPYQPYSIQVDLMRKLYEALELGKIGIFESPTGTGKSLSIICAALTWLKDFEARKKHELAALLTVKSSYQQEPGMRIKEEAVDWVTEFAKKQEMEEIAKKLKEAQEQRLKREEKLKQLKNNLRPKNNFKRKRNTLDEQFEELFKESSEELQRNLDSEALAGDIEGSGEAEDDQDILVGEYISDDDGIDGAKEENNEDGNDEDDAMTEDHVTKIYYCSRTHSQLAQFVREVQKSPFRDDTRVVSLGSRQNLCINEAVKRLKSMSLINERCLDLQKSKSETKSKGPNEAPVIKKTKGSGCPFYKQDVATNYRDRVLVEVKDIEQLVVMGKQMKACPYYGTRLAIPTAQLVVLPYNTLLHKSTREASGIRLEGNIVIIDEGHNLMETISNIHSIEVTGSQLSAAHCQLSQYLERYKLRLKAKNLMYMKQLLFILSNFIRVLEGKGDGAGDRRIPSDKNNNAKKLQTINDFLFDTRLDNLNLFKVHRYCQRSMISKKLHGFAEKYHGQVRTIEKKKESCETSTWALSNFLKEIGQPKESSAFSGEGSKTPDDTTSETPPTSTTSSLQHIEGFLEALTNADKDGRIIRHKEVMLSKSSLKFLLLNPGVHFADVLSEARAVIIAGGTMQPIADFKEQLLFTTGTKPERILEFSCGHVIPADQILPIALARGSSGLQLDFTYQSRTTTEMMDELGRVVYNTSNIVSGGIVVFFPSYEHERLVHAHWEQAGFLQKISVKKKIFREPKVASQVNHLLQEYTAFIKRHPRSKGAQFDGALLSCVVGGKMSEGINFSDDLGRCIIMVGLPYPNIHSAELKEKMDYLNAQMPRVAGSANTPGQAHFENLCMKAVNQSIGRAIRHKDDYAAILLLDYRYARPSVVAKLPNWIKEHLRIVERFGPAFGAVRKFFSNQYAKEIVKIEPL